MTWLRAHWLLLVVVAAGLYLWRRRRVGDQQAADAEAKRLEGEAARQRAFGNSVGEASRAADRGVQDAIRASVDWPTDNASILGAVDVSDVYGWGWWRLTDGGFVNVYTKASFSPGTSPINVQNAYDKGEMDYPVVDLSDPSIRVQPVADDRGLVVY